MSKIKNGGLDHYGAGPFEQRQFGTAGVEAVKQFISFCLSVCCTLHAGHESFGGNTAVVPG